MFGVIEGSGGDNDEPAACCMNQKVRQETIWRPFEAQRGVRAVSSPECRHIVIYTLYIYMTDIIGMSHYPLRNITITCMSTQMAAQGFCCCNGRL